MHSPATLATLLAATLLRAAHAADKPFLGPLAPFEVSDLSAPCGGVSPDKNSNKNISFTITNPNRITAGRAPHAEGGGYWSFENSTARCAGAGAGGDCAEMVATTASSSARWSFRVLRLNNGTGSRGFDISVMLDYNVTRWGGVYYKVLEGTGRFAVGDQLVQHGDGDGAGCELVLADGKAPVLVPPAITECKGTC
ncbi:hypothetical protein F4775DRAFT_572762 [Biscogniauxia sp. FL1348]|nr:hypothetical protein F4775DRAFT_572762 [Biscogniauxia sp. FL1348]